jgi:uncharacterized protein Yka (UPF0111/DUF47 family)
MVESPTDSDEWSEATIAEKLEQINADGEKKADEATTAIAELLATFDQEVTLESESDIDEFVEHTQAVSEQAETARLALRKLIAIADLAEDLVNELEEIAAEDDIDDVEEIDIGEIIRL